MNDIAARRLQAHRLIGEPFESTLDAIRSLTAVQSQDYAGAKWALGQRSRGTTDAELDRLFDEGAILRTHLMRPTWHFVLPEDIGWLLALTGPRVRAGLVARNRELEIDDRVAARSQALFTAALAGGRHKTRTELGEVLRSGRISPDGQRLPHLLMRAELDAVIGSGPRRGKQFTYALLKERAPKARALDRDEAVAELTLRYFRSRGPAQVQDFVWWSGLKVADARAGIAAAGKALEQQTIDGKTFWFDPGAVPTRRAAAVAHLLPNYDEYTVAYRDRAEILHAHLAFDAAVFARGGVSGGASISFGSILSNVVTIGGKVRGSWRRSLARDGVRVEARMLDRLTPAECRAVQAAGRRLGEFLERPVELSIAE
ncbi:MAG TPA: winged helix DNA-binding domain-containing protein [Candidatus Angelobacter sp.]|nr:winged helix DNA-binding domain-containing protein [Candidatus Angelobacter sp.]